MKYIDDFVFIALHYCHLVIKSNSVILNTYKLAQLVCIWQGRCKQFFSNNTLALLAVKITAENAERAKKGKTGCL